MPLQAGSAVERVATMEVEASVAKDEVEKEVEEEEEIEIPLYALLPARPPNSKLSGSL